MKKFIITFASIHLHKFGVNPTDVMLCAGLLIKSGYLDNLIDKILYRY